MSSEKPDQIQASVAAALSRLRGDLGPSGAAAPRIEEQSGAERPRPANDVRGDPFFRSIQSPPLGAGMTTPGRAPIPMFRTQAGQEPSPQPESPSIEPPGASESDDAGLVQEPVSSIEIPEMPESASGPPLAAAVPQPGDRTAEPSQPAAQPSVTLAAAPPQASGSNSPLSRVLRGTASPGATGPSQRDLLADLPPPPISEPLTAETETGAMRRRRRNRRLLALAAVIVVAAIGAWLWTGGTPSTEVPVVAAETTPEKVKPVDEGGLQVQNQNVQVLDPSAQSEAETVMPEPEQPITPPASTGSSETAGVQQAPTVVENGEASPGATAEAPAGDAAPAPGVPLVETPLPALEEEGAVTTTESAPAAPSVAAPEPTQAAPTQAAEAPTSAAPAEPAAADNGGETEAAQPAAEPATAPAPAAVTEPAQTIAPETPAPEAPAPAATAAEAPAAEAPASEAPAAQPTATQEAAATPAVPAGNTRVQLAAGKSEASVEREWAALQKAHPQLLGDLSLTVERADKGAAGIFYRLQAGPLADKAAARDLCASLKQRGQDCIVVTK